MNQSTFDNEGLGWQYWCILKPEHRYTGHTKHFSHGQLIPSPVKLMIGRYPDSPGYYLIYVDERGDELTDTYHDDLKSAFRQAELEFGVVEEDWERLSADDAK